MLSPYDRRYTTLATNVDLYNSWIVKWARKSIEAAWGRIVSRFPRFRFAVVVWHDSYLPDFDNYNQKNPDFPKINMTDLIWSAILLHNMAYEYKDEQFYDSDDDSDRDDSDCIDDEKNDGDLDSDFIFTRDAIISHLIELKEKKRGK